MSFCSNCGHLLIAQDKFCTSCGSKLFGEVSKHHLSEYQEKMYKNVVISLKKEGQNFATSKAKEAFSTFTKNQFKSIEHPQAISEVFKPEKRSGNQVKPNVSTASKLNKWTWIYLILNGLLVYLGHQSDQVIGVLIFSVLILGIVFFRRKTEKPYNWLVKILLIIQLVFLVALVAEGIEYISYIIVLFIGLLITDFILLFKGNNI